MSRATPGRGAGSGDDPSVAGWMEQDEGDGGSAQRFGAWTVRSVLAERRESTLYAASDGTGRAAVVKRHRGDPGDEVGRLRFERERRLAWMLRHPAFATLLGEGPDWLVFERLERDLKSCGRDGRREGIAPTLGRIAVGLAYLHARGIVHRDLKPEHVLFRPDGTAVLIDLGAAGFVSGDPTDGVEAIGSPAWMAPEQADGRRPAPAADIWSLACIGRWLLGASVTGGPGGSRLLHDLVGRGLDPDPARRPSAAEFCRLLTD